MTESINKRVDVLFAIRDALQARRNPSGISGTLENRTGTCARGATFLLVFGGTVARDHLLRGVPDRAIALQPDPTKPIFVHPYESTNPDSERQGEEAIKAHCEIYCTSGCVARRHTS
jgi:hypothetical protein